MYARVYICTFDISRQTMYVYCVWLKSWSNFRWILFYCQKFLGKRGKSKASDYICTVSTVCSPVTLYYSYTFLSFYWYTSCRTTNKIFTCISTSHYALEERQENEKSKGRMWKEDMYVNVIEWCKLSTEFENISLFCTFLFSYLFFSHAYSIPVFLKCWSLNFTSLQECCSPDLFKQCSTFSVSCIYINRFIHKDTLLQITLIFALQHSSSLFFSVQKLRYKFRFLN
jgi:hypothetical protein